MPAPVTSKSFSELRSCFLLCWKAAWTRAKNNFSSRRGKREEVWGIRDIRAEPTSGQGMNEDFETNDSSLILAWNWQKTENEPYFFVPGAAAIRSATSFCVMRTAISGFSAAVRIFSTIGAGM